MVSVRITRASSTLGRNASFGFADYFSMEARSISALRVDRRQQLPVFVPRSCFADVTATRSQTRRPTGRAGRATSGRSSPAAARAGARDCKGSPAGHRIFAGSRACGARSERTQDRPPPGANLSDGGASAGSEGCRSRAYRGTDSAGAAGGPDWKCSAAPHARRSTTRGGPGDRSPPQHREARPFHPPRQSGVDRRVGPSGEKRARGKMRSLSLHGSASARWTTRMDFCLDIVTESHYVLQQTTGHDRRGRLGRV